MALTSGSCAARQFHTWSEPRKQGATTLRDRQGPRRKESPIQLDDILAQKLRYSFLTTFER